MQALVTEQGDQMREYPHAGTRDGAHRLRPVHVLGLLGQREAVGVVDGVEAARGGDGLRR